MNSDQNTSTRSAARGGSRAQQLSETFVLLDHSSTGGAKSLLFEEPVRIVQAWEPADVADAVKEIEDAVAGGLYAAGFYSYELGYVLEPKIAALMPEDRTVPLLWFGLYKAPAELSSKQVENWLSTHKRSGSHEFTDVALAWDENTYIERFDKVRELIRAGDIYQLNLTFKARFHLSGSPLTFYQDLRAKQRVAYGGIVDTGDVTILSSSPEVFIAQDGRVIETRPMKGTAARAGPIEDDKEQREILATDVKQRAENLMIVDLMRNDVGRISEVGSVEVTDLFTVETFKTLHQMTSGIRATLQDDVDLKEMLDAIFPPGSIIGAPKIRAMELIRELETEARGVYCGAIGYISPAGTSLFNVAIRTPVIERSGKGEMGIGSGVVYDSDGAKEYAECLLKMQFLTDPPKTFELIETMLHEPGKGLWLFEQHLERLAASAGYFGYAYDERAVRTELDAHVSRQKDKRLRVRLLLAEDGAITVASAELPEPEADPVMRYAISKTRLDCTNPFLYHKTTRRELYDVEWASYHEDVGSDEVIYLNEDGALAEGSRTSIFIERDGKLLTPPLSAGLLPGTLRADLLVSGRAVEAPLKLEDLENSARVFLGNSVRGLVRAEPVDKPAD